MKYISRCQTPIGELTIVEENSKITNIIFENSEKNFDKKNCIQKETPLLQKTCGELSEQSHMVKQKATKKLQNK